jgi:hypothetical protein
MSALTGQIATAYGTPANGAFPRSLVAGTTQGHTKEREVVFAPRVHGPLALLPLARFYDQREADLLAHHTIWIRFGLSSAKARAGWLTLFFNSLRETETSFEVAESLF